VQEGNRVLIERFDIGQISTRSCRSGVEREGQGGTVIISKERLASSLGKASKKKRDESDYLRKNARKGESTSGKEKTRRKGEEKFLVEENQVEN